MGLFAASWLSQWRSLFGSVETLNLYTYYVYSSNDTGTTEFLLIECPRGTIIGSGMVRLYTKYPMVLYVCMVTHMARAWIDRVGLTILHVVSLTGKINVFLSTFTPKNLVSRDGFGSPVPRQPVYLHTQAECGAYLRDSSRVSRRQPFIYFKPP